MLNSLSQTQQSMKEGYGRAQSISRRARDNGNDDDTDDDEDDSLGSFDPLPHLKYKVQMIEVLLRLKKWMLRNMIIQR